MYIFLLKENLERIEKENKGKVKFTFFDAKDNQSLQNESIKKALTEKQDLFIINLITHNLKGRIGSPLTYLRTKHSILALNEAGIKTEEIALSNCEQIQDCAKNSIEAFYSIGMNLAFGRPPLENTNYKFDNTGFTVHLTYKEYTNSTK